MLHACALCSSLICRDSPTLLSINYWGCVYLLLSNIQRSRDIECVFRRLSYRGSSAYLCHDAGKIEEDRSGTVVMRCASQILDVVMWVAAFLVSLAGEIRTRWRYDVSFLTVRIFWDTRIFALTFRGDVLCHVVFCDALGWGGTDLLIRKDTKRFWDYSLHFSLSPSDLSAFILRLGIDLYWIKKSHYMQ